MPGTPDGAGRRRVARRPGMVWCGRRSSAIMGGMAGTRGAERLYRTITDDVLTVGPPTRSVRGYLREGLDRLLGADPGMTQLRTALQAVLGIALGVSLVSVFVPLTGALQLPAAAGPPALVSAHNHGLLIVSMLLAGMVAMMAGFTVTDPTARGQIVSTLLLPLPMVASMTLGLALGRYRVASLVFLVVLLAIAVYVRRWGPRGFAAGLVAFNGGFLGFFLHAEIGLSDLGWLAADLGLGVLASLVVRFLLFRPDLERTLTRMRRSWEARGRRMLALSVAVLDAPDAPTRARVQQRLHRQAVRLNESTLMIDAQLAAAVPTSAALEAQRLFDAELALSNCARFAGALAGSCPDPEIRARARTALAAVRDSELLIAEAATGAHRPAARAESDQLREALEAAGWLRACTADSVRSTVLAHRLGASVEDYVTARGQLRAVITDRIEGRAVAVFTPAVELNAGFLPGSAPVSTAASETPGRGGLLDRSAMPPYVRASIQITVAATLAIVVGDLLSGPRLYWAVLATFLAFMATTNSGEQARKALFRVAGTAVGIVVGDLLVRVTGGHVWSSLLIVLVALFFGIYLIRVNYTFMVIGITVTMSQLYAQLGEFSWHLLVLRLGETAIGVGAVVVTVLVIVPLRPQRVLTAGVLIWFRALSSLVRSALDRLVEAPPDPLPLRPLVRDLDAAYAALEATAVPLRSTTFGRNSAQLREIRAVSAAARHYARSLAAETEAAAGCAPAEFAVAADQLRTSLASIEQRIETGCHGRYVRSAALVELTLRSVGTDQRDLRLALRDLTLLDGALARLAAALEMDVLDHDTTDGEPDVAAAEVAGTRSVAGRQVRF